MPEPKQQRRKTTLDHLSRIEGQLRRLRSDIESDQACLEVATLASSIARSFDALRLRTLEGFVLHELLEDESSPRRVEELRRLLKLSLR